MYEQAKQLGGGIAGQMKSQTMLDSPVKARALDDFNPQAERPTPMMEIAVRGLMDSVCRIEALVTQAETRFSAVVAIEPPTPDRGNAVASARRPSSQLASGIEQIAGQLDSTAQRLQSLIQRCEL